MRKLMVGLVIALMVMGLVNVAAHAQGNLREYTGYQVMNLATAPGAVAHVRVDYYGPNGGAPVFSRQLPDIAPKASYNVQQKIEEGLPDGVYSAVLSSDQPIAAVVAQVEADPASPGTSGFQAPFSNYTGASAGSRTVVLPSVMHNWYGLDTLMRVQNVGDAPANISIQYFASTVAGATAGRTSIAPITQTVARYAAATIDQSTMASILAATDGTFRGRFFGSAVITSDQPLVAIVNETDPNIRRKYTYNGFGTDAAGTELVVPAIYSRWFGTYTTLSVQNTSLTNPVDVTITYKGGRFSQLVGGADGNNQTKTVTFRLQPGEASNRNEAFANQSDLQDTFNRFGGNARITATGAVVAKINQQQTAAAGNGSNPAGAYNATPVTKATARVAAPLIQAQYYGLYTTLACANASATQDAQISVEYTSDNNSLRPNVSQVYTHTIPANGGIRMYEAIRNGPEADINTNTSPWYDAGRDSVRFNGAAYLTSTNGVGVVCVVNEQTDTLPFDNMNTYDTVNLSQ
ncbi:MAG: hypothetical protein KIT87_21800 [Anaerolineae bacterium]|nr:hypothetical protein [Anaerolineae bacterium]